jgi:hypothetical protein
LEKDQPSGSSSPLLLKTIKKPQNNLMALMTISWDILDELFQPTQLFLFYLRTHPS